MLAGYILTLAHFYSDLTQIPVIGSIALYLPVYKQLMIPMACRFSILDNFCNFYIFLIEPMAYLSYFTTYSKVETESKNV